MEQSILNKSVSEFYDINNKYAYTKLKNLIAPIICYVERNLNEVSYKKYGISASFKEKFCYLANRLNDEELDRFIRFYKKIRALNVHARTYYLPAALKKTFSFDLSKLSEGNPFLELDVALNGVAGELTVYGMLFVLSTMLSESQFRTFLDTLARDKYLALPAAYRSYKKRKEILNSFVGLNVVQKEEADIPLIFCAERDVIPILSETYLILEEEILKNHTVIPKASYLSFPESLAPLEIPDDLKERLRHLRNMWAHGNCFYYTSPQDNVIVEFIECMQSLSKTQDSYGKIARSALKKLKITLLHIKYKRPAEMALKLQKDRLTAEGILRRLATMTNFSDKDELVPLFIEEKLSNVDCGQINFGFNNKKERLGVYPFSRITIVEHRTKENLPFIVEGFHTDLTYFKEYCLPEYPRLNVKVDGNNAIIETATASTNCVQKITAIYGE